MHSKNSAANKALVAYVPALHAGYVVLFKKYKRSDMFILGASLISLTPRMERDIRALSPEEALHAIQGLNIFHSISILENGTIKKALSGYKHIILPDEDVSRNIAQKFLKNHEVSFEKIFLRWDKNTSMMEFKVPSDRIISTKSNDLKFLREAIGEASKSPDWWRRIGAVLVKGKKIKIRAYNRHFPSDATSAIMGDPRSNFDYGEQPEIYLSIHAEADIIAQAARMGILLEGSEIFVTTFPCANCARLLARVGIKKLFYAQGYSKLDAEKILKSTGIEIVLVKT
ncbi:MAG: deaminase [bacterium]|nr:deaminase [bacterium]